METVKFVNLAGAELDGNNLKGADLSNASFSRSNLVCADFFGANFKSITRIDFTEARRSANNGPIPGWTVKDGVLVKKHHECSPV